MEVRTAPVTSTAVPRYTLGKSVTTLPHGVSLYKGFHRWIFSYNMREYLTMKPVGIGNKERTLSVEGRKKSPALISVTAYKATNRLLPLNS